MWLAKDNIGVLDTTVRSVVSTVVFAVALEGLFSPVISIILVGMSLVIWTTCVVGICPFYHLVGINTLLKDEVNRGELAEQN